MLVFEEVIDEDVARLHVISFVAREAGNHLDIGKMASGPGNFLGLGPASAWTSGKDDWLEMSEGFVQRIAVGEHG